MYFFPRKLLSCAWVHFNFKNHDINEEAEPSHENFNPRNVRAIIVVVHNIGLRLYSDLVLHAGKKVILYSTLQHDFQYKWFLLQCIETRYASKKARKGVLQPGY